MKQLLLVLFTSVLFSATYAQAQFDSIDTIPVSIAGNHLDFPWAGGMNYPLFSEVDLNGDGIHDLFVFDRHNSRIMTFINNGDTNIHAWRHAPEYETQFPAVSRWVLFYDYDNDGRPDLFTLSSLYPSGIDVYRNEYTHGGGLQWTLVKQYLKEHYLTIMVNIFASAVSIPAFSDIDGDGDMDILGYNSAPDGRIVYHKNYSMELYGIPDSLDFTYETGCWGNFALLIGGANSVGCFHCPCRERGTPAHLDDPSSTNNPQSAAAPRDDTISSILAIDIDGNGVKDLLVGDISSDNSLLVHNGGTPSAAEMDTQVQGYPASSPALFYGFHFHAYIDLDNDGKKDLIVSSGEALDVDDILWYKDVSASNVPDFSFQGTSFLQDEMIDVGSNAAPVLVDYDGDGLLDIIAGASTFLNASQTYQNSLWLLKNIGTATVPEFTIVTKDMNNISALQYNNLYPSFADMDGDSDPDMLLGIGDGTIQYFNNAAGAGNPANFQLAIPNYMNIDVGNNSTPQLIDLDRDLLPDLVIGEQNGFINYFYNSGHASSPSFTSAPTVDTLGCINRQLTGFTNGYTSPFVYDSLGNYRMMVANMSGNVFSYSRIDNNIGGCYTLNDSLYDSPPTNRIQFDITVSGGDLNGDGLSDLLIGQSSGGIRVFYQHNPTIGVAELEDAKPTINLFPNPANDQLSIRFNHVGNEMLIVRIVDNTGKLVFDKKVNAPQMSLNTMQWANGIYLIQVSLNGKSVQKKFTISH